MQTTLLPTPEKSVTQLDRERYDKELGKGMQRGAQQLEFFAAFAENTPEAYTNLLEFFDAVPKFFLAPQTNLRKGVPLQIQHFEFDWGNIPCKVSISPVVLESRDHRTKGSVRKEILPGPREETVYRVLKKMAADPFVERAARENSVVLRFTLHNLRKRLAEVGHEFKVYEIREALEVLSQSPLKILNNRTKKMLYSGGYIALSYASDVTDQSGEGTKIEVAFNVLAIAGITAGLYDRIHYTRLMSLSPLAAWVYELITRNFRQAGGDLGFKLSLGRVLRESGLPPRKELRHSMRTVKAAFKELVDKGVLSMFPAVKEKIEYSQAPSRGRKSIVDVQWVLFPHADVARDIRDDNAAQLKRRNLLQQRGRRRTISVTDSR